MRNLLRNQDPIFYRRLVGSEEIVDDYGNVTGSYIPIYGDLMSFAGCVSANKGTTESEQFGMDMDYDRTITTADPTLPIDETSVLWLDGADTRGPYNYIVRRVSRWHNSLQLAVKRVDVTTSERGGMP